MKKVVIVGGGAAGLATAVMIKNKNLCQNTEIVVLERNDRVGKKLAITGNGRCNISNVEFATHYHGEDKFAEQIISLFNYERQQNFFDLLGVPFVEKTEGKLYPSSLQAASVVDALRFKAEEQGIKIITNCQVESISFKNEKFYITANETYQADAVVVATGAKSGGKIATDCGYGFLKAFGHKIETIYPSLVPLKTDGKLVRALKGIKVDAEISAVVDGTKSGNIFGELLFCDYGLSGPPVLQLSAKMAGKQKCKIVVDLLPDTKLDQLVEQLNQRKQLLKSRQQTEFFTGFINKRLGQEILKLTGHNLQSTVCEIDCFAVAKQLKNLEFLVVGDKGFENAQATRGGAQVAQFFDNMMSKKQKGLFSVGEVLNVDGDCGGYNLAFAWASANACANGIIEFLK